MDSLRKHAYEKEVHDHIYTRSLRRMPVKQRGAANELRELNAIPVTNSYPKLTKNAYLDSIFCC